ncbi:hypothetical protein COLO4_31610 [Corchorus olitorius]|uniref:Uncharacterized protein n=1 Tax=Corchorus olitorius TaxID=93759 RepID=A0A1R3H442_9ROSI|nr:hypothetical protein COLO4_31610 [Corchorus olitorius]
MCKDKNPDSTRRQKIQKPGQKPPIKSSLDGPIIPQHGMLCNEHASNNFEDEQKGYNHKDGDQTTLDRIEHQQAY